MIEKCILSHPQSARVTPHTMKLVLNYKEQFVLFVQVPLQTYWDSKGAQCQSGTFFKLNFELRKIYVLIIKINQNHIKIW